jgi:hypothetical protein
MTIHAAKIENSPRLQKTLAAIADRQWHSTAEIHQVTGSMAVHTDIAEINAPINDGYHCECRPSGNTENDRSKYEYRLASTPSPAKPQRPTCPTCHCDPWFHTAGKCDQMNN